MRITGQAYGGMAALATTNLASLKHSVPGKKGENYSRIIDFPTEARQLNIRNNLFNEVQDTYVCHRVGDIYLAGLLVENQLGIHLRPAKLISRSASDYDSDIFIQNCGNVISAKSIMSLMTLGVSKGTRLVASAKGPDSEQALEEIIDLFKQKFSED